MKKIDGLRVVDAKKALILHIKACDIAYADIKNPQNCAAARACKRDLGAEDVRIHLGRSYIKKGKKWIRYMTPSSMRDEIIAFDRGGQFEPGEFKLNHVRPSKRLGKRYGSNKKSKKIDKKRTYHVVANIRAHA